MKNHGYNSTWILGIFLLLIQGCSKTGPDGLGGPWVKGTLEGSVSVTDEFGNPLEEKSGFTIKFESVDLTATTDESGYFRVDELPTGTYNISCSKQGFVTTRIIGYGFIGGGDVDMGLIWMTPPSTTQVSDIHLEPGEYSDITFSGTISPVPTDEERRHIRLFFHKTSDVSSENYIYTEYITPYVEEEANGSFSMQLFPHRISEDLFYDDTDIYYVKAYGVSYPDWGYPDLETGLRIYPSLNKGGSSSVAVLEMYDFQ